MAIKVCYWALQYRVLLPYSCLLRVVVFISIKSAPQPMRFSNSITMLMGWSYGNGTCMHYLWSIIYITQLNRPLNARGERIPPSDLSDHRSSHRFLGPCCICPLLRPAVQGCTFVEAAIFMATHGRLAGQYLAVCARGRCGYIGE